VSLYIDLSEFLDNPITTGIQRIVGEMCRHLPPQTAIPVRLQSGRYVALCPALISAIGRFFDETSEAADTEIRRLGTPSGGADISISSRDTLLVPEVFWNAERVAFFRQMPREEWRRVRFIVYDLLPLTHPEYFHPDAVLSLYAYYQLIREADQCGFISEDTRNAYYGRLRRTYTRGGVVLPLGCDAFGARVNRPALNRPSTFTVLGTIEPRKNHALIVEAFEPLLRETDRLNLVFVGKMGWVDSEFARKMQALASRRNSGFQFRTAPGDCAIRSYVGQSRATIYVSSAEGYGLPPVESLWLGTPVIASKTIPSLKDIGCGGVHYVEPLTAANLAQAVQAFLNDDYANQKTEEAARLSLPTWKSFTEAVLHWCGL
jgi:glycosyltransferase involved in cell wall biosynthesis